EVALLRGRGLLERKEFAAARAALTGVIAARPRAVLPRLLLSYAYLQEGKDWEGAERALHDVLALDPAHQEALHNLAVLVRQQGRVGGGPTEAVVPPPRPDVRPRVSLTMIVKDEEANLPACLGSVRDLVDEVVVVDTGSADRTKEVAAGLGARVFDFPW